MSTLDLEGKKTILFHKLKIYINMNKYKSLKFANHKVKYSENGNGIFINLNYIEEPILNQIILFIKFCIKNKTLLDKEIYKREEIKKYYHSIDDSNAK